MKKNLLHILALTLPLLVATASHAKLPGLSDEAKAKAAETAAKTAWSGKVDGFLLCKSQDRIAAKFKTTKAVEKSATPVVKPVSKDAKPAAAAVAAGACTDPGQFVYTPAVATAPPAVAPPSPAATTTVPAPAKKS
jgi:hypothetical protein